MRESQGYEDEIEREMRRKVGGNIPERRKKSECRKVKKRVIV